MQNTTPESNVVYEAFVAEMHLKMTATLADADYRDGFQAGLEAYESQCEDVERNLTHAEVLRDLRRELYPTPQQHAMEAMLGIQPKPLYDSGFLAGWLHAHLTYRYVPDTSCDTEPLANVLPFH